MTLPTSIREVQLVDGRAPNRPLIGAKLYRDFPLAALESVETLWADSREEAARGGIATGLAPLEHAHWDWRNKADSVEAHYHLLVAVECEGEPQGLMAVTRFPRPARLGDGQVLYVDYVESAPWNLKGSVAQPRFFGVGTLLIADAVRLSLESGLEGRLGLHSLPQAELFLRKVSDDARGNRPGLLGPRLLRVHCSRGKRLAPQGWRNAMNSTSPQEFFRQAAESEGGMAVSAGARLAHVRRAVESGRSLYVDLSGVPASEREAVVQAIHTIVKEASTMPHKTGKQPSDV